MRLNSREKAMLHGEHGEAVQLAMSILQAIGEIGGAEEMVEVACAHIDGCSYYAVFDSGLEFAQKLVALGGRVAVPTTLNITSRDIRNGEYFKNPPDFLEKNRQMEEAYYRLGCIPTWTCAPYQYAGVIPSFGQHVAWAESNAVNYVNSVIGARSDRYGDLVDICCAIAGRVPLQGLHLTKNRAASIVFDFTAVDARLLEETSYFAAAGYLVGNETGMRVPVVTGMRHATHEDLKAFSAAAAASGPVGLFHVEGVTPEAPTLAAATQGKSPETWVKVTDDILLGAYAQLSSAAQRSGEVDVDLVVIGCPHVSYSEIVRLMELMEGRTVSPNVEFWLQTNDTVYHLLARTALLEKVLASGIRIMRDGCLLNQPMGMWGFKIVVTNSGKMAHYAPGNLNADVYFRDMRQCAQSAVSGKLQLDGRREA